MTLDELIARLQHYKAVCDAGAWKVLAESESGYYELEASAVRPPNHLSESFILIAPRTAP